MICHFQCFIFFRNIFQTRTLTGFRDEHIWVSIWDPPSRSPFTRAQRVSCCMSLLLCTMAINIAFWNIPEDLNSPELFSLGDCTVFSFVEQHQIILVQGGHCEIHTKMNLQNMKNRLTKEYCLIRSLEDMGNDILTHQSTSKDNIRLHHHPFGGGPASLFRIIIS